MTHHAHFLTPYPRYRGVFSPQHLAFDANLQEFSQRISFICNLANNGKLSPQEAFDRMHSLWQQLEASHAALAIGE